MSEHKNSEQVTTETFAERSPLNDGVTSASVGAGAGLLVSAVRNGLQTHNKGAMGVFTRSGSTIAIFAAMGGIFSYTDAFVANTRGKKDALNGAVGGCAAGVALGAVSRSVPMMAGSCLGLATLIGTFDAAGGSLQGLTPRPSGAAEDLSHGELSWRERRDAQRARFFKQKKEDTDE